MPVDIDALEVLMRNVSSQFAEDASLKNGGMRTFLNECRQMVTETRTLRERLETERKDWMLLLDLAAEYIKDVEETSDPHSVAAPRKDSSSLQAHRCVKDHDQTREGHKKGYHVLDLREADLPNFVSNVEGFSWVEEWGRWTNADCASVLFNRVFSGRIVLHLVCYATELHAAKPLLIAIGGTSVALCASCDCMNVYQFDLQLAYPTSLLEVFIPNAISPTDLYAASTEDRRLGLAMQSIAIYEL